MRKEVLFTVGPVEMYPDSLEAGSRPLPYFRTEEFSAVVADCERGLLEMAGAPRGSRAAFLTLSGTGGMEACLSGAFGGDDRLLVVDGGTFGHRWTEICDTLGLAYDVVTLHPGSPLTAGDLDVDLSRYSGLLINAHETSTGVRYDMAMVADFCRRSGLVLVVDAISAFLCDEIDMAALDIDFLILSSQKALALAPGLSMVLVSPRAQERLAGRRARSYYLDLSRHLKDGERGQTPFTPAVGVILQLSARLVELRRWGDASYHCGIAARRATGFRGRLEGLPLRLFAQTPSNALTSLSPTGGALDATAIFRTLKERYGLFVTPNGGELARTVFRVGHMGNLTDSHYESLIDAMKEILK